MIRLIVAIDNKRGMADDNGIPWSLPSDKKYFAEETGDGIVVMGFRTYQEFDQPLGGRQNFVVNDNRSALRPGFQPINDIPEFLKKHSDQLVWIIGGANLFAQTIRYADELYITKLDKDFHCTKFFPEYEDKFELSSRSDPVTENDITYAFEVWKPKVANQGNNE